jgi:hypothetical protein
MRSGAGRRRAIMETDPQAIEVQDGGQSFVVEPTRSDVEWLRAVSDWFRVEASRLEEQIPA